MALGVADLNNANLSALPDINGWLALAAAILSTI